MRLAEQVAGTLTFITDGESEEREDVKVDFNKKKMVSATGDKDILKMEATEAVDTAELIFFILQPDI